MLRKVSTLFIFAVGILAIVQAQGPPQGGNEDDVFDCFDLFNCRQGDEGYAEAEECYNQFNEDDIVLIHEWFKEYKYDLGGRPVRECRDFFCNEVPEEEDKKNWFHDVINRAVEYTTKICQKSQDDPDCQRWNSALKCLSELVDKKKKAKECGSDSE